MTETIRNEKWHWDDMQRDLEEALAEPNTVTVFPHSLDLAPLTAIIGGKYKDKQWTAVWKKDVSLVVNFFHGYGADEERLVCAFSKVVGYDPLYRGRYVNPPDSYAVNWIKQGADVVLMPTPDSFREIVML